MRGSSDFRVVGVAGPGWYALFTRTRTGVRIGSVHSLSPWLNIAITGIVVESPDEKMTYYFYDAFKQFVAHRNIIVILVVTTYGTPPLLSITRESFHPSITGHLIRHNELA